MEDNMPVWNSAEATTSNCVTIRTVTGIYDILTKLSKAIVVLLSRCAAMPVRAYPCRRDWQYQGKAIKASAVQRLVNKGPGQVRAVPAPCTCMYPVHMNTTPAMSWHSQSALSCLI